MLRAVHPSFEQLEHRPWPKPDKAWAWRQSWVDLAFLHWPIPVQALRPLIPDNLTVDTFDGTGWIGVVPFRMEGVMRRPLPDLPGISAFPELNVRTYVTDGDKGGVWFFSLDAQQRLAVWAARQFFHLPYFNATFEMTRTGDTLDYLCTRGDKRCEQSAVFDATYRPTTQPYLARPDTLEHWLTERYCLYSESPKKQLYRGEVHHAPWPLQKCDVEIRTNTIVAPTGLTLPEAEPVAHFASRVDVVVWDIQKA